MAGHWSDRWVGRAETDCAALVGDALAEVFGVLLPLPSERRANPFAESAMIAAHGPDLAEPIAEPYDGCGVLMTSLGRLQHIGLYCTPGGRPHVLHATPAGVVRHRVRDLAQHGYEVEGWYRWK